MRLILTRHGETEENRSKIIQGHLPGKLSKLGRSQAEKLALRLKNEKIDAIYSSDLARAANTAKEIARYHECPLIFTQKLRERHMGGFQGKRGDKVDWEDMPDDAETLELLQERAKAVLDEIYARHMKETVLVVAHGNINTAILNVIYGNSPDKFHELPKPKNTSLSIFELEEDNNHKIHLLNSTEHLE